MSLKTKIVAFSSFFVLIILINLIGVLQQKAIVTFVFKPFIVFSILLFYIFIVKKEIRWLYVLSLICVLIADIFYLFETRFFLMAMIFYTINHVLLIIEILKFTRKIKLVSILQYFIILVFALIILYFYVLKDQEGSSASVLLFGISMSILVALALANYLKKMSKSNFYLMLGLLMGTFSNLIVSLNAFSLSSDITINILGTVLLAITHYTICYSFIIRDTRISLH